ncbi:MAG TPA: DUF1501 domain-containing protein [Pyrinomonadaceae bacterium]|nr:DUF1501 domain-containing protein [Pyrinomonadaceae bacterium]
MDRRFFLKTSGIGLASFGLMAAAPDFLHQFAAAQNAAKGYGKKKVLVTIFQRGAVDGLNVLVPYGESEYYNLRPTIAVAKPGQTDGAIKIDDTFGLHPSLKAFEPYFKSGQMAAVTAVGSPDNTRSHFDAQDYMESATPGNKGTSDGWLNRVMQNVAEKDASPFRAVSMTQQMPRALYGKSPSVAMTNMADFSIQGGIFSKDLQGGFEAAWEQNAKQGLGDTGKETFEAVNFLKSANPAQYKAENGAVYPNTDFGRSMQQIAQLIKANVGLEVAFTDTGNGIRWDTHTNEGNGRGQLAGFLTTFSNAIAAFAQDLGKRMDDVVVLTMSEFGRTARENGGRGTDHGHANTMFVLGNSVKGGKVYGEFKGLKNDKLYEGRDLDVTTDFRDVFGEVATKHMGAKELAKIFPNYSAGAAKFRGYLG